MKSEILNLRNLFREWYATLSVAEVVGNRKLTQRIEAVEQRFLALGL